MITIDEFVEECPNAANESEPVLAVKEVVERALSDGPDGLSEDPGLQVLSCDESLTVVRVVIPCGLGKSLPHDHRMWAVSGWLKARRAHEFFLLPPAPNSQAKSTGYICTRIRYNIATSS